MRTLPEQQYGLELTNNSKASWAFSLPRENTCIFATEVCKKLCYGNGIRYQTDSHKAKCERNFRTVELLLAQGGPELLAQNLIALVDQIRPSDWLAAQVTGRPTRLPWSIRIHDIGDFREAPYAQAWLLTARDRPNCSFWFYTRSFLEADLFQALTDLASLPNVQGWLSIDSENYVRGFEAYETAPGIWKLALLQDTIEPPADLLAKLIQPAKRGHTVNFPYHRGGHHIQPIVRKGLVTCPAVTGIYKLQPRNNQPRPCQLCKFCLPN